MQERLFSLWFGAKEILNLKFYKWRESETAFWRRSDANHRAPPIVTRCVLVLVLVILLLGSTFPKTGYNHTSRLGGYPPPGEVWPPLPPRPAPPPKKKFLIFDIFKFQISKLLFLTTVLYVHPLSILDSIVIIILSFLAYVLHSMIWSINLT